MRLWCWTPTSITLCQLCAPDEAQEASACVRSVDVASGQEGLKVVVVQRLVTVNGEVTASIVRAAHPDLTKQSLSRLAFIYFSIRIQFESAPPKHQY
jgi:hypothetical protein